MLRSLLPKAHHKFLSLPLLGPITDGFDDWLAASGFTLGSRTLAIHILPIADKQLRRRGVDQVAKLNHAVLDDCCRALKKIYPCRAGTIHTLERYLVANGLIIDGRPAAATQPSSSEECQPFLLRKSLRMPEKTTQPGTSCSRKPIRNLPTDRKTSESTQTQKEKERRWSRRGSSSPSSASNRTVCSHAKCRRTRPRRSAGSFLPQPEN